jgi:hypothetical protein
VRTLSLDEASSFLRLPPHEIITQVELGRLPGAKFNNELIFIDLDLAHFVRGHYCSADEITKTFISNNLSPAESSNHGILFKELVPHMLRLEENRLRRNELTAKSLRITHNRLDKYVAPYFNDIPICNVDYMTLEAFIEELTNADIKGAAISQYMIIVRKVLNYALLTNAIQSLPQFPRIKTPRQSRGAFTVIEYRRLLKTAWRLRDQPYMMQNRPKEVHVNEEVTMDVVMPRDMTRLIGFMVNSFIRPSDLKFIQHKHIEIIEGEYRYLRLSLPETKKHDQPIVTMTACVGIYQRLLKDAKSKGYGKPNDYLFVPEMKNRDHALRYMGFLFIWILENANLKFGKLGQNRTLYCLRHTAITFRLLYGEGVDLLTLAKNARTSVNMIERHYASTLNGEMNIGLLHSKRAKKIKIK